jgi:hypothetical protein
MTNARIEPLRGLCVLQEVRIQNEWSFKSEMTRAFPELENVDRAPLSVSQDVLVCLDCAVIKLALRLAKLEQLKQAALRQPKHRRSAS